MSNKRTTLKKVWLNDSEFTSWLKAVKDNIHPARCTICMKTFELSNMGRTAVSSHNRSVQHQKRCSSGSDQHSLGSFVTVRNASTAQSEISVANEPPLVSIAVSHPSPPSATTNTEDAAKHPSSDFSVVRSSARAQSLNAFVLTDIVTKSEILWAMKIVVNHMSYRSCLDLSELFQTMFPESEVAQKFTMSKTKAA